MRRPRVACALGALICALGCVSTPAHAATKAALVAHVDARAAGYEEASRFDLRQELTVGTEARALLRFQDMPLGYAPGVGYQFGTSLPASFVYDVQLYPLGFGFALGGEGFLTVAGGGRFSGATALVPASGAAATEARLELGLPGPLHASLWFAPTWQAAEARRAGTRNFSFADEISAGLALRIGVESKNFEANVGAGLLLGAQYFERGGARGAGLLLGFGADLFQDKLGF